MTLSAAASWYGTTTARLRALLAGRVVVDARTGAEKVAAGDLPALERRLRALGVACPLRTFSSIAEELGLRTVDVERALHYSSTTWPPATGERVAYACDIPVVRSWARRHERP